MYFCRRMSKILAIDYDRNAAEKMARLGAHVGAMTPEQLAEWMGKIIA